MSWERLEWQWKQQRGRAVYRWGKMMNDELSAILGKYEKLVGKFQEKYGIVKDEAMHHVDECRVIIEQLKQTNKKLLRLHQTINTRRKTTKHTKK